MHLLGAIVLRLMHGLAATSDFRTDVLSRPEFYIESIRIVLLSGLFLANVFQGWAAYRLTRSRLVAAVVQLAPILSATLLVSQVHVLCEPLLMALAFGLSGLAMWWVADIRAGADEKSWSIVFGVVLGVGTATKLPFAGLALLPVLLLRSRRVRFAVVAASSFAVCLLPIATKAMDVIEWIFRLGLREGAYGTGPPIVVSWARYASTLWALVRVETLPAILFVAGCVSLWLAPARLTQQQDSWRALRAVLATQAASWLLVAKAPVASNYVVPAASLSGLSLALLWCVFTDRGQSAVPALRRAAWILLLAFPLHAGWLAWSYFERRGPVHAGALRAMDLVDRNGGETRVLQGYRVSTVASALSFGNEYAGHAFSDDLRRLHPGVVSSDWKGIHVFGRQATAADLAPLVEDGTMLLWDSVWDPIEGSVWATNLVAEPMGPFGRDRLLRVPMKPPESAKPLARPFAGLLFLAGLPDLSRRFREREERPGLGPQSRAVFVGDGGTVRLRAELRNELPSSQTVMFQVNGLAVASLELRGTSPQRLDVKVHAPVGINELVVSYGRSFGPLDEEKYAVRVPGYARGRIDGAFTGIRFRYLQVTADR